MAAVAMGLGRGDRVGVADADAGPAAFALIKVVLLAVEPKLAFVADAAVSNARDCWICRLPDARARQPLNGASTGADVATAVDIGLAAVALEAVDLAPDLVCAAVCEAPPS
ncbi:hypothetical protein VFPPC_15122 [Pochonia chlamydosporia 170]|uniref:Uncharacterized protein n=1 Tax=Pochonia chlamydosporia 170 TaxID=1380566 RepID=A0A179G3H2_METCM|nr:hypothetical protein VFPPC_15122 [Pochonia chlamydosporia 170]OAQ72406.1 hypothetical protein VFPPC_15122 [Pochonia chlamydosporia 170]